MKVSGCAVFVGLAVWQLVGKRGQRSVKFCVRSSGLPMTRSAVSRGVKQLEAAGLVSVVREPGKGLLVTVLDVESGREIATAQ